MIKRTIIEMALEAGMVIHSFWAEQKLEAFAKLVREDERNRTWTPDQWTDYERSDCADALRARGQA